MKTYYLTDKGKVRDHNEDSVTILKNANNEYLMVVADGMGGHRKGEVASALTIKHLGERFLHTPSIGAKLDAVKWLNDNINVINKQILKHAQTNIDSYGMGTTLVAAIITNEYLIFANIGDSSGYVYKNNLVHKITKDHTLVNLLVDAGNITDEEAKHHPKKNVLMKALGVSENVEADIYGVDGPYDGILLCSDGLTNLLSDDQIEIVLNQKSRIEDKVRKLIDKCNTRGGIDNISVALLLKEGE